MKKLFLLLLCIPLLVFSQEERRLALVIGNANYDKGKLNNPVNDALLISETLQKLDFDIILLIKDHLKKLLENLVINDKIMMLLLYIMLVMGFK